MCLYVLWDVIYEPFGKDLAVKFDWILLFNMCCRKIFIGGLARERLLLVSFFVMFQFTNGVLFFFPNKKSVYSFGYICLCSTIHQAFWWIWWNYRFCDNEGPENRAASWIWPCDLFRSICCWSSHSRYSYYQWQTSRILQLDLNTEHHPFLFFFFPPQKSFKFNLLTWLDLLIFVVVFGFFRLKSSEQYQRELLGLRILKPRRYL